MLLFPFPLPGGGHGADIDESDPDGSSDNCFGPSSSKELVLSGNGLVPPGDVFLWSQAIIGMLDSGKTQTEFDGGRIPDIRTMTEKIVEVYEFILGQR